MKSIAVLLAAVFLCGCAVTDRYAGRSQKFNEESNDFYNEMILMNVVRASYRAPVQFTELESVTGQTTSSGSMRLSTPVGGFPFDTVRTINPEIGGSTQTIFTAKVQNSQEFYQGVSTPLSPIQASYFVRTTGPKELVYGMLFGSVTLYRSNDNCSDPKKRYLIECTLVFQNNPRDPLNFPLFQATMEYLIRLGFSMEIIDFRSRDLTYTYKDRKTVELKKEIKDNEIKKVARYCFRPRFAADVNLIKNADSLCGRSTTQKFFSQTLDDNDQSPSLVLDEAFIKVLKKVIDLTPPESDERKKERDPDDDPKKIRRTLAGFVNNTVRAEFTTRSTLDVFEYVGSVVAEQRKAEGPTIMIRSGMTSSRDQSPCGFGDDEHCDPIMVLSDRDGPSDLSVDFDGRRHQLRPSRDGGGYGLHTIAILKRILGLNTSSKNTPAPVILTASPPI